MGRFIDNGADSCWCVMLRTNPRDSSARAHHFRLECSGIVVVYFSPSRMSRFVVCRGCVQENACHVASCARGRLLIAWPAARRYSHDIGQQPIHFFECMCVRPAASSAIRSRCTWSWLRLELSVGDAIAWVLSGAVLTHGSRSLICTRVIRIKKLKGEMKVKIGLCADRGKKSRGHALPGRLVFTARKDALRAYTLGS